MDSSAQDGTVLARRAREAAAQRARPTGRLVLVTRIGRCLGLALPAGLHPVTAHEGHSENHHPNKHSCLLRGAWSSLSKAGAERRLLDIVT